MTPVRPPLWRGVFALEGVNSGLAVALWWNVVLLLASLAALLFDRRQILGLNPWIKPIKFEISIIIYVATISLLVAMLSEKCPWRRALGSLGWGFGIAMIVENTIIAMQSGRGVRSHMNIGTPFDAAAFSVMGMFIGFNTVLLAVLLVLFFVTKVERPEAELWGIRLGLMMMLAGSVEGVYMVMHQAHTVGAPDGSPGLPFLNWSYQHGDLRVAHFFALHALQALWAAGWLFSRLRLAPPVAITLTWLTSMLYAGVVWVLFEQALAARSILVLVSN